MDAGRKRTLNILFDTKKLGEANNMEKAFDILSQRGDNCSADMLNEIREVYLCELGKMEIPNFEKEYLALQDYLTSFPSNPQKVKTTFVKEMKTWGSAVVDYCMMTDNSQIEQNWLKGNHTESLLNTTAINNINQYWGLIEQTRNYNMMRLANETARNKATTAIQRQIQILQLAIPKNASSETMSITNKVISVLEQAAQSLQNATMIWRTQQKDLNCADIAKSFIEYFEQCCTWLGYNGKLINKKEIVEQHSIIFATKTNEAIDFLGKRSISPFTSCGVQNALERCFNMGSEHKESFDIIFEFLPPLQFGLLLQTLHKIAIDSNEEEMYKTLANLHIKNYLLSENRQMALSQYGNHLNETCVQTLGNLMALNSFVQKFLNAFFARPTCEVDQWLTWFVNKLEQTTWKAEDEVGLADRFIECARLQLIKGQLHTTTLKEASYNDVNGTTIFYDDAHLYFPKAAFWQVCAALDQSRPSILRALNEAGLLGGKQINHSTLMSRVGIFDFHGVRHSLPVYRLERSAFESLGEALFEEA